MSLKQMLPKTPEKRHVLVNVLAVLAVIIIVAYVVYTIITANIQIRSNNEKLKDLKEQTAALTTRNEQINGYLENDKNLEAYIEEIARDKLDFANGDERIFYVIPAGN